MLTHGAAVSEKEREKNECKTNECEQKWKRKKKKHKLAAEEGGQSMPKKGITLKKENVKQPLILWQLVSE